MTMICRSSCYTEWLHFLSNCPITRANKKQNVYLKRAGFCAWYPRDALVSCRRGDGDGMGSGWGGSIGCRAGRDSTVGGREGRACGGGLCCCRAGPAEANPASFPSSSTSSSSSPSSASSGEGTSPITGLKCDELRVIWWWPRSAVIMLPFRAVIW